MKIKSFKVREIDGEVAKVMTDKQAGELYKAICAYNFNNEEYKGKDNLVKSVFALMKDEFVKDKFFRETGKQGGEKSASIRRENVDKSTSATFLAQALVDNEIVNYVLERVNYDLDEAKKKMEEEEKMNKARNCKCGATSAKL
jgi:hypothetical protein